jgi:hypothetical protein
VRDDREPADDERVFVDKRSFMDKNNKTTTAKTSD